MNTLQHISRYERPSYYAGETYESYYSVYGRHRDSDLLTESNWDHIVEALGGESDTVIISRASHWAVGWVEQLLVHESDTKALEIADNLIGDIKEYPILDDEDFYRRESEARESIWESMNLRERVCMCLKANVSIFSARSEYVPEKLEEYITI